MILDYVALDLETTGLNPKNDRIIEIGMVKVNAGKVVDSYETLIDPLVTYDDRIVEITGITRDMVSGKPHIEDVISHIVDFIGDYPLLGHNVIFDYGFIKQACINNNITFEKEGVDTLKLARVFLPDLPKKTLSSIIEYYGINDGTAHRAYYDALKASEVYLRFCEEFGDKMDEILLHPLVYKAKKQAMITKRQNEYLKNLIKYHKIEDIDVLSLDALTKSQASRLTDKILSTYGRINI